MTSHYPIVLERETNGTVSAYVVGVPGVFAAADTEAAARAIRSALQAHLATLQHLATAPRPLRASLRVARITYRGHAEPEVGLVGLGALLGRSRGDRTAEAGRIEPVDHFTIM